MEELNWEEVVAVPSKKFAYVNVSCKFSPKTNTTKMNVSLTSEIVSLLGWKIEDTKYIQCMTAVDPSTNKRLLQFIVKQDKRSGPFEFTKKLKGSGMIVLYDQPWMPKRSIEKQNVFHHEATLRDGILRIELPNVYTDADVEVPVRKKAEPPANPTEPAPPVEAAKPVKQHVAVDEIIPGNNMKAVLGKCRMHACGPEITPDNELITFYNNEKRRVKLQSSWALVLRKLMAEQERGVPTTETEFFTILLANGIKFKQGDSAREWTGKLNTAYLEQTHLRVMISGGFVCLTTAND